MSLEHADPRIGFRLLYVCTGNVCRSPFAEVVTRRMLADSLGPGATGFEVRSAGIAAAVGTAMDPGMYRELERCSPGAGRGVGVTARRVDTELLHHADLVLTMTVEHRGAVVGIAPGVLGRTFVLGELARLCALIDPVDLPAAPLDRARALTERARFLRSRARPMTPTTDDIADPIGRSRRAHRAAADGITRAVRAIVELVAEPPGSPRLGHRVG